MDTLAVRAGAARPVFGAGVRVARTARAWCRVPHAPLLGAGDEVRAPLLARVGCVGAAGGGPRLGAPAAKHPRVAKAPAWAPVGPSCRGRPEGRRAAPAVLGEETDAAPTVACPGFDPAAGVAARVAADAAPPAPLRGADVAAIHADAPADARPFGGRVPRARGAARPLGTHRFSVRRGARRRAPCRRAARCPTCACHNGRAGATRAPACG